MVHVGEHEQHKKKKIYQSSPLRTKKEIKDIRDVLKLQGSDLMTTGRISHRNLMLFNFGCATGLRASDIVKLKVKDIKGKENLAIRETKTGKISRAFINDALAKELNAYIKFMHLKSNDYLFPSSKHGYHVSTTQVYRFLQQAGHMLGRDDITTHTMRRTFGYQFYKQTHDIAMLQKILNHSSPAVTKRYIGIEQEEINNALRNFSI
ncbi:integrase [Lactobacillus colini]|uniref:Integrase n=1 Tax=Lactobacillus colini TaxID=1819254 RepID=A0ABS4MBY1_9LACO|nr:tyrosine-type recombinase/integrase [Lactobacillus colini]MBP2057195.1 integrase [Lactobacillus colini]